MELLIGDKKWSSWSMRPWLVLKHVGEPFDERLIRLRSERTNADARAAGSPNGQVPVLKDGALAIHDSLAICEYVAERHPGRAWPTDQAARALGRAAAAEMHAGFHSLRGECPMDLDLRREISVSELTHQDLRRLVELWSALLGRFGGQWLVGDWSIADAFFTPVASRLRSYGLRLSDYGDQGPCAAYAARLLAAPEFLEWEKGALADPGPTGAG